MVRTGYGSGLKRWLQCVCFVTGSVATDGTLSSPGPNPCLISLSICAPIFENRFHPCEAPHLRKINSPETEACDKDVDAITQRLVIERIQLAYSYLPKNKNNKASSITNLSGIREEA